jgi:hypothetical protein
MSEPTPAQQLAAALQEWREAKPNSAAERRAARQLAYQAALLLRSLGVES